MTDISTIVAAERTVEIKHPGTSEPIGLKITVLPDSDQKVKAMRRKWLNERLQRGMKITAEKLEVQQLQIIESAVSGWEWGGDLNFHGEKPAFTEGNLRKVLKELPWIKTQLDEELGDEAAFFQN
jgi:hypothetical protein